MGGLSWTRMDAATFHRPNLWSPLSARTVQCSMKFQQREDAYGRPWTKHPLFDSPRVITSALGADISSAKCDVAETTERACWLCFLGDRGSCQQVDHARGAAPRSRLWLRWRGCLVSHLAAGHFQSPGAFFLGTHLCGRGVRLR